ncbi:MAG: hypothetical protein OEM96_09420, partial [Gemmatimonadota bacterium]|nr:hypothetical protein [Gemmatimonadota bacterium]
MRRQGWMGGWCSAVALFGVLGGPGDLAGQTASALAGAEVAAASIDAADLRMHLGVIADDSMRGRATPSP